jgi:SulP family sulfate permease
MTYWMPQAITALREYDGRTFVADLIAGVTVGFVALPLAMAFAIASGMPPQNGIYCAIVGGFLTSALGGSTTAIGGPTGAFVVVVAGIIAKYGVDGLYMCTMMAAGAAPRHRSHVSRVAGVEAAVARHDGGAAGRD